MLDRNNMPSAQTSTAGPELSLRYRPCLRDVSWVACCVLMAACTAFFSGCAEDDADAGMVASDPSDSAVIDGEGRGDSPPHGRDSADGLTEPPSPPCAGIDPSLDSDGDGIPDVIEDANQNCRVDPGETDPFNPDTDGDGLLDGEEDVDGNGVHDADRGELDPRNPDTYGNGILDGDENIARVCTSRILRDFEGHRLALGTRQLVFVHPARDVSVLVEGRTLLVREPSTGDIAILNAQESRDYSVGRMATHIEAALNQVSPQIYTAREHVSALPGVWSLELVVGSESGIDQDAFASVLAEVLDIPSFDAPTPSSAERGLHLRVEADVDADGRLTGRMSVSVAHRDSANAWFAETGVAAIAPSDRPIMRAFCEEFQPEAVHTLDVVVVVDTLTVSPAAILQVADAIASVWSERARSGLDTRIWLVPPDAHAVSRVGSPTSTAPLESPNDILEAMLGDLANSADTRIWLNAVSFVTELRTTSPGNPVVVLVLSAREDTEFRAGSSDGRDGNFDNDPLPAGEARASRTRYYSERVADLGATVVALAPRSDDLNPERCLAIDTINPAHLPYPSLRVGEGRSFREIALLGTGHFLDVCQPDVGATLARTLTREFGSGRRADLAREPIRGTLRMAIDGDAVDRERFDVHSTSTGIHRVRVRHAMENDQFAAAYLFWDRSNVTTLRAD